MTDVCVGPVAFVCNLSSGAVGAAQGAASDYVLGGLGESFIGAAAELGEMALSALDATTSIDLGASWFRANVAVVAAIALPVLVGLFVIQVLTSVLRHEPGGLPRAVVGVGKAILGAAIALGVTQLALTAVDEICRYIAAAAGMTVAEAAARFFDFAALAQISPALQLLLGLALMLGFILLWGVLLFRKAALILIAVFAPIAFAGSAWDQTRVWTRRWLELVAALVFSKIVIVVAFVVGASAFAGTGPTVPGQPEPAPGSGGLAGLSDALVGLLLLAIAIWAPWLTWRFVHWSGMEAAATMHSAVAANPISKVARSTAATGRSAAQRAVMSSVLGPAGAAAGAAHGATRGGAGSGTAGAAAGAKVAPLPSPRPTAPAGPPVVSVREQR